MGNAKSLNLEEYKKDFCQADIIDNYSYEDIASLKKRKTIEEDEENINIPDDIEMNKKYISFIEESRKFYTMNEKRKLEDDNKRSKENSNINDQFIMHKTTIKKNKNNEINKSIEDNKLVPFKFKTTNHNNKKEKLENFELKEYAKKLSQKRNFKSKNSSLKSTNEILNIKNDAIYNSIDRNNINKANCKSKQRSKSFTPLIYKKNKYEDLNIKDNNNNNKEKIKCILNTKPLISKKKFLALKNEDLVYCGQLEKVTKIPDSNIITYSNRFCILTKEYFSYYKSKESYIAMNRPMLRIKNKYILRIESSCINDSFFYIGIIYDINNETKAIINKINSFVMKDAKELLIGFRSNNKNLIDNWFIIINYFIELRKNQNTQIV